MGKLNSENPGKGAKRRGNPDDGRTGVSFRHQGASCSGLIIDGAACSQGHTSLPSPFGYDIQNAALDLILFD